MSHVTSLECFEHKSFYCTLGLFVKIVMIDLTDFFFVVGIAIKLIFVLFQDCDIRPKRERLSLSQVH